MKRAAALLFLLTFVAVSARAQSPDSSSGSSLRNLFAGIKSSIEKNLGRPYVWGAVGLKSYDCSGFAWRVMFDNGVLIKRTTARKLYMMLKPVPKDEQGNFGTLVFFDDLQHMGIVNSSKDFYHAQSSVGTNLSPMNAYWKKLVFGYRQFPVP